MDIASHVHLLGPHRVNSMHALHAAHSDAHHVPHVTQWIRSFEQNDLEVVADQRSAAGDFKVAAIVTNAARQGESASVNVAINARIEIPDLFRDVSESGKPVGQLTGAGF